MPCPFSCTPFHCSVLPANEMVRFFLLLCRSQQLGSVRQRKLKEVWINERGCNGFDLEFSCHAIGGRSCFQLLYPVPNAPFIHTQTHTHTHMHTYTYKHTYTHTTSSCMPFFEGWERMVTLRLRSRERHLYIPRFLHPVFGIRDCTWTAQYKTDGLKLIVSPIWSWCFLHTSFA